METRTVGELLAAGIIEATTGFPFGGHNEDGIGIPHIRPFNVGTDGDVYLDQIKSVPTEVVRGKPTLRLNDIVFNNTNTLELAGKCALWPRDDEPVFSNHMTRVRVLGGECDPAYLSFAILQHWATGRSQMLARAHVAQASIIGARFNEIAIPWRPVSEQRAIGGVLKQLRAACRLEGRQIEVAQKIKQAATRELFTRGLRGEPRKEAKIGLLPESWEVVPLGSLGRIGNGSTPKKSILAYWQGGNFPWLPSAKVYDRDVKAADQFVTRRALDECHLPVVKPGAVLVAITGQGKTLGHCAVLRIQATISQHVAYLQTDISKAEPEFLRGFLETRYEYLRQVAAGGGSTKGALTCAFLRSLSVPLPSKEEQRNIVTVLDALDHKVDLHRQKRAALEELFKALLHKLMTGEIKVGDLDLSAIDSKTEAVIA